MQYEPQWQNVFEGWSRRYIAKEFWRVRAVFGSEEDALQQCALTFAYCNARYSDKEGMNDKWFMALYKTAIVNHWHKNAVRDPRFRTDSEVAVETPPSPIQQPDSGFLATVAQLPSEVRGVIMILIDAPSDVLGIVFKDRQPDRVNMRLKRLFGVDPKLRAFETIMEIFS